VPPAIWRDPHRVSFVTQGGRQGVANQGIIVDDEDSAVLIDGLLRNPM
jgi:hypothetical protein